MYVFLYIKIELTISSYFYDRFYKPFFEIIQPFIPNSIHPNMITSVSFFIVSMLYMFGVCNPFLLSAGLFLYWLCDGLDGVHARATKQCSDIGEILDHCIDSYSTVLIVDIFRNLFQITNPLLSTLIVYSFGIVHLMDSYTNNLELGYKYFSVDEINLLLIILPFLQNILSTTFVCNLIFFLCILMFVHIIYNLFRIKDILNTNKTSDKLADKTSDKSADKTSDKSANLLINPYKSVYTNSRVKFFISIGILDILVPNRLVIALFNMFYVYIIINLKYKTFCKY